MKIYYLGTCSGTEPMPGMHHCALVMEIDGVLYWFDAGECAVHTAHNMGLDVTNVKSLFISHPHIDHTGGLANLFACMNKMCGRYKMRMKHDDTLHAYMPAEGYLSAACLLAGHKEGKKSSFAIIEHQISDGVIFDSDGVRVTALHNKHLKETGENGYHSYSFLVEGEGKRVIFSGDLAEPCEIDALVEGGCDLLIMETGHHAVSDVCEYARSRGVKVLRFNHHGREILEGRERAEKFVADFGAEHGMDIRLCYDTMTDTI